MKLKKGGAIMQNYGGKSRETFEHVAETHERLGDKNWAAAKNNSGEEYKYSIARQHYETAEKARQSAKKLDR